MPYNMDYYYNNNDSDKVAVKVYDFACVGQLCPTALVYTLEGRDPNDDSSEMPPKEVWLTVPVQMLKP